MAKIANTVLPYATKAIVPLASGALSGLANLGVNKLFKSGSGLFSVPQDKVDKLIKYNNYLTTMQKKLIISALQNGSGFTLQLTRKQHGNGFLLSALASMAIPMVIKAITGKGKGKGLQIEGPQPYYGQWPNQIGRNLQIEAPPTYGYGRKKRLPKKKVAKGLILGKKTAHLQNGESRF